MTHRPARRALTCAVRPLLLAGAALVVLSASGAGAPLAADAVAARPLRAAGTAQAADGLLLERGGATTSRSRDRAPLAEDAATIARAQAEVVETQRQADAAAEARRVAEAAAEAQRQAEAAALAAKAAYDAGVAAAVADPRGVARGMLADHDWRADQFGCLDSLWTKESGWQHTADNPSSSAYGIPQALPGERMASAGEDWRTNPRTQIAWGLEYIASSYGTPCGAWAHSRSYDWY